MFDLTGKTALVTGSTQGIGFAIAKALAEHGAKVYVNGATSMEKCTAASEKIPESVPVLANLLSPDAADTLYAATGDVDILVLNASIQYKHPWNEYSAEEVDTQFNCNVKSSYFLIQKYAPGMKAKGWGRIVTLGSVNMYNNHPQLSLYGVTKAAQYKLVQNVAADLAPYGVTVNDLAPGAIYTPRNAKLKTDKEWEAQVVASIPAGYVGEPEDVVPAALLLCSPEARYITGAQIVVDGGMRL